MEIHRSISFRETNKEYYKKFSTGKSASAKKKIRILNASNFVNKTFSFIFHLSIAADNLLSNAFFLYAATIGTSDVYATIMVSYPGFSLS